jgi:hypothetical protein
MQKFSRLSAVIALLFSAALVHTSPAQNIGTALVNGAPQINSGRVEGNVQQMTGANATLNSGAVITGDLLVPGTPTLIKNGTMNFGGTIVGTGSTSPSNYQVILNGSITLGHLRTRTNPVAIPALSPVPTPTGTRTVTITAAGQSAGNFATLRNLTLNGNVGQYAIPAGTYGDFIANGGSGFTLGVAGATQATVYNFQHLTLNGQTNIIVLGPVVINVANGFTANGTAGTSTNPAWLKLNVVAGGFTLNGGCNIYGYVNAPGGTVIINGATKLVGGCISAGLTVNANGLLQLFDVQSFENHPPVAANQAVTTAQDTAKSITLSATDADGQTLTYSVVSQPAHGSLSGTPPQLTYTPTHGYYGADSFTFKANDGQADSNIATVSITVTHVNHAPVANAQSRTLNQGSSTAVTLTGSDSDNDPLTFRATSSPAHGALSGTPPNLTYTPAQNFYGSDSFTFVANDGTVDSPPATVSITVSHVNHPPVAAGQSVQTNEDTAAAISLSATDVDSDPLTYSVLTSPAHGTLSGTAPNLTYTPAAHFFGSDSFTFRANDGSANSNTATVQITVVHVNHPPVAAGKSLETNEDTAAAILLSATDPDSDPLTYSVLASPTHGTLSGTTPNLTYTPAAHFFGSDSFTFRANDGSANSNTATVQITVVHVNHPPVAAGQSVQTNEDTAAAILLSATDADSDPLTYSVLTSPTHGTLSGAAPTLTYTPAAHFFGTDSFTFKANDGSANSNTGTIQITVLHVNHPPTANGQNVSLDEDTTAAMSLTGSDPDGDAITFSIVVPPAHGTLTGSAPNVVYTPAPDYFGTDSFAFRTNDGSANSQNGVVNLTVRPVNDPPTVQISTPSSGAQFDAGDTVHIVATASDIDGTIATFRLLVNGAVVSEQLQTSSATFDLLDVAAGDHSISAVVIDNEGASGASAQVPITARSQGNGPVQVNAGPDRLISLPATAHLEGSVTVNGAPAGSDVQLVWQRNSGPGNATFDSSAALQPTVTFDAPGVYVLKLVATAPEGTGFDTVKVTVLAAPTAGPDSPVSNQGREFWMAFLSNPTFFEPVYSGANLNITSETAATGTVEIYNSFQIDGEWQASRELRTFSVEAGGKTVVAVHNGPPDYQGQFDQARSTSVHIVADAPVAIHALNFLNASTDGSLILPTSLLGLDHFVMSYRTHLTNPRWGTECAVVATKPQTSVTITPSSPTGPHPAGQPFTVTLQTGEVYRLISLQAGDDLTGTRIQADKPVAVYGGHGAANVPFDVPYADHLYEQIPPVDLWGRHFLTVPLRGRTAGDLFRLLASKDNTHVSINGQIVAILNRGQFYEAILTQPASILADQRILVAQFAQGSEADHTTGDPFLSLVPPYETFGRHYIMPTPYFRNYDFAQHQYVVSDIYDSYLTVVVDSAHAADVRVNGQPVDSAQFFPIADSGFSGASVSVPKNSTVDVSSPTPIGTLLYGWAPYESYGFTGGLYGALDSATSQFTLTQSASAAPVGSSHRVRAQLIGSAGLTVPDATVTFSVTGANPTSGSGLTAPDGSVEFTWQGTQGGVDTVTATSGVLTATVSVNWVAAGANQPPQVNAGADVLVALGQPLALHGVVQDDGHPGGNITLQWSALPGPGDVTFADPTSADTTASFIYPGQYRLRLTAYDGQFAGDDDLLVTVDIPPAFIALLPSSDVVDAGKQWTVGVSAIDRDGLIARVELIEGGQVLDTLEPNEQVTSYYYTILSTVFTTTGPHSLTVRLTDNQGATADSSLIVTVRPAPTVQILSPADNTIVAAGGSVSFTASASSAGGPIVRVVYSEVTNYYEIGDGTGSDYQLTWTPSYAGTFLIAATAYDSEGASGTSAPITITVLSPGDPTVTITSPANGSSIYPGQTLTVHADVTAILPAEVYEVDFVDGYQYIGSKYSPPFEVPWSPYGVGSHTLTAYVYDTFGGSAQTSVTVNVIPVPSLNVTLVEPQVNMPVKVNSPTALAATVENVIGTLQGVQFYVNGQWIGDGSSSNVTWTPTAIGDYEIDVYAYSYDPYQDGYIVANVTVADLHSPVVQWIAPANNASFAPNTPIVLQAQASDIDSNLATLQFIADGQLLSETPLSGAAGVANCTWSNAGPGWHALVALADDDTLQSGVAFLRVFVERQVLNDLLPPSGLASEATSPNGIHLVWNSSTSANSTGTAIERRAGIAGTWVEIATVDTTVASYDDSALAPETYYSYRLAALDASGARSIYSEESSATTFIEMPTYAIIDITESLAQQGIAAHFFDFKHLVASNTGVGIADPIELQGTRALSVNDSGDVLVDSGHGNYTVWRFQDQSYTTLARGAEPIVARTINAQGIVAGSSDHSYQDPDNNVHLEFRAQTWINGAVNEITPHDSLGDYHEPRGGPARGLSDYEVFEAYGIADSNDIAGRASVYYQDYDYSAQHAALWSGNQWINVGGFEWVSDHRGRMLPSYATAVNGSKQVVGVGAIDSPQLPSYPPGTGPQHAFLSNGRNWNAPGRTFQDLGTLGGYESAAWDINAGGFAIGVSTKEQTDPVWRVTGFVWEGSGTIKELPTLGGINTNYPLGYSYPMAINDQKQIVGQSLRLDRSTVAALWQKNQNNGAPPGAPPRYEPIDLNDAVGSYRDWFLVNARDISNSGLIVGQGIRYTRDGQGQIVGQQEKAYLLIPITVKLTQPSDRSIFAFCDNVELKAEVSGFFANLVTRVEYWAADHKVAESTNPQGWPATWTQPPQGSYSITARGIIDSTVAYASSKAINATVLPITRRAVNLIIEQEVTSRGYYERRYRHPDWPGKRSGVTIGIGYDLGKTERARIESDWGPYVDSSTLARLMDASGTTGLAAKTKRNEMADIDIPYDTAAQVYYGSTLPYWISATYQAYPEAATLPPSIAGALVSMVFNRGSSLTDAGRNPGASLEMRQIADALRVGNVSALPGLFEDMTRLWPGNSNEEIGLRSRRRIEANMIRQALSDPNNVCN